MQVLIVADEADRHVLQPERLNGAPTYRREYGYNPYQFILIFIGFRWPLYTVR